MKQFPLPSSFPATLPVLFGYVPMGMAFGLLMANAGYAWYVATLMGLFIYAGAAQFLAVGLLAAQAGLLEVAVATFLLNSRHIFYGLSLMHRFKARGWRRLYLIFGLTDETFSLLTSQPHQSGQDETREQVQITALNQSYWVIGCTLGALLGHAIHFDTTGLEFTLPALFIVLVIEQYRAVRRLFPFVIAVLAAAVTLMLGGAEQMLLISIALALCLLLWGRKAGVMS